MFFYAGGDEWKVLAERLGFFQIEIRFLDKRVVNPLDVVLGAAGKHRYLSVGEIYDTSRLRATTYRRSNVIKL